jgi:hypothetical protein
MAVTNKLYGNIFYNALMADITDISSAGTTIKCCLLDSGYTFNQDTHVSYNDIAADEISSSSPNIGYTTGGATLTGKTLSYSNKVTTFDSVDASWSTATFTARYAVVYDDTPAAAADKKLLCIVDFGEDKSASAATFQIVWSASGIFSVTVA